MEIAGDQMQSANMDHHGLVAAVCDDLKIQQRLDARLGPVNPRRKVSPGMAVKAMILNGLGFTNRRLYLMHQFFDNKPIEQLLGPGLAAKDITDVTLGNALDEIAGYGSTALFGELAHEIGLEEDLLDCYYHLDTSTVSVHGAV